MKQQKFLTVTISAFLSVLFVAMMAQAVTTISTNMVTDGTLSVTGNSTLTSADIGGGYTAGSGTGATVSAAGALSINGDFAVNGYATTTAATGNIETAGTLTVVGNSVLTSADIGGGYAAGSGSGSTLSTAGVFSLNGNLNVNGMATTTASNGQLATQGNIGTGTTTPHAELTASGSATTTLYLHSTNTAAGGCLQLEGPSGTVFRMYATSSGVAFFETGTCK